MAAPLYGQLSGTEVTKWQDGKDACASITYDDSSINQFRVAIPLMNERGLPGTFFIITGDIDGAKYQPAFIGRPIRDILRESEKTPTAKDNMLERTAMLNYRSTVLHVPELKGYVSYHAEGGARSLPAALSEMGAARWRIGVASGFPLPRTGARDVFIAGFWGGGGPHPATWARGCGQWHRGRVAATPLADVK